MFPKLTKLKELMLEEITVAIPKSAPSASPDANADCARTLEVLVIKDVTTCEHDNGPVLPAILDALSPSSIESLTFDRLGNKPRCSIPDHSEETDVTLVANLLDLWGTRPPLDVQHLSLSDPSWVGTAAHFRFYEQKMVQPGCLCSLVTRCDSWKITEQLFAFLHTCGSKHFECLELDIIPLVEGEMSFNNQRDSSLPPSRWRDFASAISSLKTLSDLRLSVPYNAYGSVPDTCKTLFSTLISRAAPPTLRNLCIDFYENGTLVMHLRTCSFGTCRP